LRIEENGIQYMEFKLKTLAQIWTGGVRPNDNSRLRPTGIKGSIRWWCEALIRGLDAYACDPTSDNRCEFNTRSYRQTNNLDEELQKICPACQLFGCTGWRGKFNLRIENNTGEIITKQLPPESDFTMRFIFIETKQLTEREKRLINATIKLIVEYGAIGGKIGLKPSEEPYKNYRKRHHLDYGVLAYQDDFSIPSIACDKLLSKLKENHKDWPNLKYFWFVKEVCITRIIHNELVNRDPATRKYRSPEEFQVFLGGYTKSDKEHLTKNLQKKISNERGIEGDSESKKIFSFHGIVKYATSDSPRQLFHPRCFGYTRNRAEQDALHKTLNEVFNSAGCQYEFKNGEEVLDAL
jgi:CRISPR-associated protein Cmr1